MFLLNWLQAKKPAAAARKGGRLRGRKGVNDTTLPLVSPRRGRRILRREQLFSVVRESMIRGGVLSSSYEFKVLTLDANGDGFIVLVDLALPAEAMPDEYLLEIERWITLSAESRHGMGVRGVYWRRKPAHDQQGMALRAAVVAQARREVIAHHETAIPLPQLEHPAGRVQPVGSDEVTAFRQALQSAGPVLRTKGAGEADLPPHLHPPESHSDFTALSETQYGKL